MEIEFYHKCPICSCQFRYEISAFGQLSAIICDNGHCFIRHNVMANKNTPFEYFPEGSEYSQEIGKHRRKYLADPPDNTRR